MGDSATVKQRISSVQKTKNEKKEIFFVVLTDDGLITACRLIVIKADFKLLTVVDFRQLNPNPNFRQFKII
jgi:hypothetical protein